LLFGLVSFILAQISLNDHLDEKLRQTKIEIAKLHLQEEPPVERKVYNVKWNQLWREDLDKEQPFVATTFGKILVIQRNRFLTISYDDSNRTTSQQIISPSNNSDPIKFVRSIVWKGVLYLLVCYGTGECSVYTGTENFQLKHRQRIQHKGYPMDATFFVRANRLFLVVVDNSGSFFVPSLIYHWRGTYMDVMTEVMTTAAVSVTTFKHKQSTIIVFAQNDGNIPGIGSMVYEFKETSLDRIQFLPTTNPTSIHHYNHGRFNFVLMINQHGPSSLFWWDGHELLHWQDVSKITAPSLVHVVSINEDTFFFVGQGNTLQLYKFENASNCNFIHSVKLPTGMFLIDIQTRVEKSTLIMMLVTMNGDQVYGVESWNLHIKEIPSDRSIKESDILSKHLAELVEMLKRRKPLVEKAEASWPYLFPVDEDLTISESLVLPSLELDSGTVKNIDIFVDEDILTPRELENKFEKLNSEIDDVLTMSKKLLTSGNMNSLNGDIVVDGDAFIDQLEIDSMHVDFLNDVDTHSNDVDTHSNDVNSNDTEESSISLKSGNITVENVQVDSICGIPFRYWSLNDDTSKMQIDVEPDKMKFSNDTVYLNSDISVSNLNVTRLNGTDIDGLFNELFIINHNQKIKGNITYSNTIEIHNLTVQTLNGKPWKDYMNARTDQSFDYFIMKPLQVENLHADFINGVPVSQAARVSTENVIKGEVKIANVKVTDKLTVDSRFKVPERQSQIYSNVTIRGNLRIGTLDLDKYTRIFLNNEEIHLKNILDNYWTKSTDQVIKDDIVFEKNLIVDRLNSKYLNGFTEEEFLYTTVTNIPENFRNLHFENVHVDDMLFVAGENDSLFDIAPESVTIREKLHVKNLHANQLFANLFNGLSTDDISNGKQSHSFPENTSFPRIEAKHVNVDKLNFLFFNDEDEANLLKNARNVGKVLKRKFTKTGEFHGGNLTVERINDIEIGKLAWLKNRKMSDLKNLVINGSLTVNGNLQVDQIDNQPAMIYLQNMPEEYIVFDKNITMDELIVENVTLKSLNGHDVNDLFEHFLSKSKEQVVPGNFSFHKITADNVQTNFINDRNTSKLIWIDEPLFLTGDVTFEDLFVEGDVVTETLNGRDVNECSIIPSIYCSKNVSVTRIADLRVDGNIYWDVPSTNSASLSYLFENAVTKDTNQTIRGDVIFEKDVSASTIRGEWKEIDDIRGIVEDTVLDDGNIVEISGRKIFKENLNVDNLLVTGNIDIPVINNVNILELNDSAVRKDRNETITGSITFLDDVAVNKILVNDSNHNVPLKQFVLMTDILPPNVFFNNLVVNNVFLKNFDGIDFNEFLRNRVTIDGDHEILGDVQFNGVIEVIGNANVSRINDIDPFDLVLNGTTETQVISGSKIFEEDVIVNGNIYAPFVNGVNLSSEYSDGIQNDEDVEIIGDLIFESKVKVPENVSVSNSVNGVRLPAVLDDLQNETHRTLQMFTRNETKMEESISQSSLISRSMRNIFAYLETEENLKIQVPNVKKVDVVYYEQITKLNMFGEEPGSFCGLPDTCSCPTEYVAEFTKDGCHVRRTNNSKIVRNYHELHSTFGVNVITNTVSYSPECTSKNIENELITISWMKSDLIDTGDVLANVKKTSPDFRGFVKDAKVFMSHENAAFVVLAVYYDTFLATHRTDSVIYKIDFEKNVLSLHQKLPTDGAWAVEVFKTNHRDLYLLLGCFGDSEKSFLYKLDGNTSQFETLRTFGGKTRNVKTLFQEQDRFVLLDDFDTNAINIFQYDLEFDNFNNYQSLFHDSRIDSVECFYSDEFGLSDSFIIVTTENDQFYIYEYMYAEKFQLKLHHRMDNLQTMVPFYYLENHYVFTGTSMNSTILRVVKQGPR
ncbi:hypothetical protein WH47_03345, partial [Habropoda laboriosa]